MLEEFFESALRIQELRDGPDGRVLEGFAQELCQAGYAEITARRHIRAAEHLIHWLGRKGGTVAALDEQTIEEFVHHLNRCRCPRYGRTHRRDIWKGARLFLRYARFADIVTTRIVEAVIVDPALLVSFCDWMRQQRGTCDATLSGYSIPVRDLLKKLGEDPGTFDAQNLRQFILDTSQRCGWASAKKCTTAVRMFLRFLIAGGKCAAGLEGAIPVLAHWRLSSLPRYLQSEEVERVIASCDPATPAGKRDRAILLLLARLGLRAGDVVQLRLGDLDWKEAAISVSGKGRRQTLMPLTQEIGNAIASYIKDGRPQTAVDTLFIRSRAPFLALANHCAVSMIVPGHAQGWCRLPEPWCRPCSPPFGSKLYAPTRRVVAGDRGSSPAPFYRDHGDLRQGRRNHSAADCATIAGGGIMLTRSVESYIAVRRATGFAFRSEGSLLQSFAAFSDAADKRYVSAETAIEWAGSAPSLCQRARRLGQVIRFARYIRAEDAHHEIPPTVFGSESRPRPVPYIFSAEEIKRILQTASRLGKRNAFRGHTYNTLFALLACTGLRVSEAIHLCFQDITADGLVIRCSKFRKSRLVPLHETTQAGLERYLLRRRAYTPLDDHVFVSLRRRPLLLHDAETAFHDIVEKIGLPRGEGLPRPTIHSLRHTFAVRALETCPDGRDRITKHMLALSTYLGHSKVADTYWYLEATPDLMRNIADSCQSFFTGGRL